MALRYIKRASKAQMAEMELSIDAANELANESLQTVGFALEHVLERHYGSYQDTMYVSITWIPDLKVGDFFSAQAIVRCTHCGTIYIMAEEDRCVECGRE